MVTKYALYRDDFKYLFKCPHVWLTTITGFKHNVHLCTRHRWHRGPHRDRLGLEEAR